MSSSAAREVEAEETVPERPPAWLEPLTRARLDALSDRALAVWVWALWADFQTQRQGGAVNDLLLEQAEVLRAATLGLDTDDVDQIVWQRVLQVIAGGDLERGGRMIRDLEDRWARHLAALDEAKTRRRHAQSIARRTRTDALQELIRDIMRRRPEITLPEMLDEFRHREHQGVVESVVDNEQAVEWSNARGRIKTTTWHGISLRMARERKNPRQPKSR
jgi:hypothetical protein